MGERRVCTQCELFMCCRFSYWFVIWWVLTLPPVANGEGGIEIDDKRFSEADI